MKYEFEEFDKRPRTFGEESDVEIVNDKGECHGGHCVRCIHAFG